MTSDQLNTALRMELINYQATNTLTDDLKRLFLDCIIEVSKREQYKFLSDCVRIYCEAKAYEDCCRHAVHYNPDKSENAKSYVSIIIRSSFAAMIGKHCSTKSITTLEF